MTYIQFKNFNDFVRFLTFSPTPFVHYVKLNGCNVYFLQFATFGISMLYYVELEKEIEEKYIIYNRFRDTISYSDKLESDGQSVCVPILEVEKTNVFQEYPFKK